MKKSGPKERPIDWQIVDALLGVGATCTDVAGILDMSTETLDRRVKREKKIDFQKYRDLKMGKMRGNLLKKQYDVAMTGNVTMLIWLGKQYLGQSDKIETDTTENVTVNVKKVSGTT
jgi:hypothetical protein